MDKYDLSQYDESDHEFVKSVQNMKEDESIVLEIQDMNGDPLYEDDGSIVEVPLPKEDLDRFLQLMRETGETFNEIVVRAIESAADEVVSGAEQNDNNSETDDA